MLDIRLDDVCKHNFDTMKIKEEQNKEINKEKSTDIHFMPPK